MSCLPTYKGKRYKSLEEIARVIAKEQVQLSKSNVNYSFRLVDIITSDKGKSIIEKGNKNKWSLDKIANELAIPKEQKELLLNSDGNTLDEKLVSFASSYSYSVEVKTAETITGEDNINFYIKDDYYSLEDNLYWKNDEVINREEYLEALKQYKGVKPTQHYSNLTVPGGTNYTENEISTPLITPSIKGHAQFSTDKGIGWFRSDDRNLYNTSGVKVTKLEDIPVTTITFTSPEEYGAEKVVYKKQGNTWYNEMGISVNEFAVDMYNISVEIGTGEADKKTRRILELQSDLFQKGRGKKDLVNQQKDTVRNAPNPNDFTILGFNETNPNLAEYSSMEEWDRLVMDKYQKDIPNQKENQFLQLLNKDSNWVTFFIKGIVQDSIKEGYEKVLFPRGETAAKIEGHETIAEEIRRIDKIIEDAETNPNKYLNRKDNAWIYADVNFTVVEQSKEDFIESLKDEKSNLKSQGIEKLKPIEAFYEIRVTNILKKYYKDNLEEYTDEYGNSWNKINLNNIDTKVQLSKSTVTTIPQNLISGKMAFGTLQEATDEIKDILGSNPHSIDMIEAGLRTRTTRSIGEVLKYNLKVGDIISNYGISANGKTKKVLAQVTAIYSQDDPEFKSHWYKEGWTQEGLVYLNRLKRGAKAIEFRVIKDIDNIPDLPKEDKIILKQLDIFNQPKEDLPIVPVTYNPDAVDLNKIGNWTPEDIHHINSVFSGFIFNKVINKDNYDIEISSLRQRIYDYVFGERRKVNSEQQQYIAKILADLKSPDGTLWNNFVKEFNYSNNITISEDVTSIGELYDDSGNRLPVNWEGTNILSRNIANNSSFRVKVAINSAIVLKPIKIVSKGLLDEKQREELIDRQSLSGLPEVIPYNIVWNYLVSILADKKDINSMMDELYMAATYVDNSIYSIIQKLEEDESLRREFFTTMNLSSLENKAFVFTGTNDDLVGRVKLLNRNTFTKYVLYDEWLHNMIVKLENGEIASNIEEVNLNLTTGKTIENVIDIELSKLHELGINISKNALVYYLDIAQSKDTTEYQASVEELGEDNAVIPNNLTVALTRIQKATNLIIKYANNHIGVKEINKVEEYDERSHLMFFATLAEKFQYGKHTGSYFNIFGKQQYTPQLPSAITNWVSTLKSKELREPYLRGLVNLSEMRYDAWLYNTSEESTPNGIIETELVNNKYKPIEVDGKLKVNENFINNITLSLYGGNKNNSVGKILDYVDLYEQDWAITTLYSYLNNELPLYVSDSANVSNMSFNKLNEVDGVKALEDVIRFELKEMLNAGEFIFTMVDGEVIVKPEIEAAKYNLVNIREYRNSDGVIVENNIPVGQVFKFANLILDTTEGQMTFGDYLESKGVDIYTKGIRILDKHKLELNKAKVNELITEFVNKYVEQETSKNIEFFYQNRNQIINLIENKNKKETTSKQSLFNDFIRDFTINSTIFQIETGRYLQGEQNEYKNIIDLNKRYNACYKPGLTGEQTGEGLVHVTYNDYSLPSTILDIIEERAPNLVKNYASMPEMSNAWSILTLEGFEKIIKHFGKEKEYEKIKLELAKGKAINSKDFTRLIESIKGLQSERIVHTSTLSDGSKLSRQIQLQIKNSIHVLVPGHMNGQLNDVYEYMKANGIDQLNPVSAEKTGTTQSVDLFDEVGNFKAVSNIDGYKKNIKLSNYKLQQDVVSHNQDTDNKLGRQIAIRIWDNIVLEGTSNEEKYFHNGKYYTGKELFARHSDLYTANIIEDSDNLMKELGVKFKDGQPDLLDGKFQVSNAKVLEVLRTYIDDQTNSNSSRYALRVDLNKSYDNYKVKHPFSKLTIEEFANDSTLVENYGETNLPIYGTMESDKFIQILLAKFTKRVTEQRFKGTHLAIIANAFMNKTYLSDKDTNTEGAIYLDSIVNAVNKKERDYRLGFKEHNGVLYAEALMPAWSSDMFKEGQLIDINDIPLKARTMLGYRIPTEGKQSTVVIEVVGFLTSGASQVVLPDELTVRAGLDYDIDSEYFMQYHTKINKDGKIEVIENKNYNTISDNRKVRDNEMLDIYLSILEDDKSFEETITPNSFSHIQGAKSFVEALRNVKNDFKKTGNINKFTDRIKLRQLNLNVRELKGNSVAFDALMSVFGFTKAKLANGVKVKFNNTELTKSEVELKLMYGNDNVKTVGDITTITFTYLCNNKTGDWKNIQGDNITSQSAEVTSNILDAIKELMGDNFNKYTLPVYKLINYLGISHDLNGEHNSHLYAELLIHQPIVIDLVNLIKSRNTSFDTSKSDFYCYSDVKRKYITEIYKVIRPSISKEVLADHKSTIDTLDDQVKRSNLIYIDSPKKENSNYAEIFGLLHSEVSRLLNRNVDINRTTYDAISVKELEDSIKASSNIEIEGNNKLDYLVQQLNTLELYMSLVRTGKQMVGLIKVFSADKIGAGPTTRNTRSIESTIETEFSANSGLYDESLSDIELNNQIMYDIEDAYDREDIMKEIEDWGIREYVEKYNKENAASIVLTDENKPLINAIYTNNIKDSIYPSLATYFKYSNIRAKDVVSTLFIQESKAFQNIIATLPIAAQNDEYTVKQVIDYIKGYILFNNVNKVSSVLEYQRILGVNNDSIDNSILPELDLNTTESLELFNRLSLFQKIRLLQTREEYIALANKSEYQGSHILNFIKLKDTDADIERFKEPYLEFTYDGDLNYAHYSFNKMLGTVDNNNPYLRSTALDIIKYVARNTGFVFGKGLARAIPSNVLLDRSIGINADLEYRSVESSLLDNTYIFDRKLVEEYIYKAFWNNHKLVPIGKAKKRYDYYDNTNVADTRYPVYAIDTDGRIREPVWRMKKDKDMYLMPYILVKPELSEDFVLFKAVYPGGIIPRGNESIVESEENTNEELDIDINDTEDVIFVETNKTLRGEYGVSAQPSYNIVENTPTKAQPSRSRTEPEDGTEQSEEQTEVNAAITSTTSFRNMVEYLTYKITSVQTLQAIYRNKGSEKLREAIIEFNKAYNAEFADDSEGALFKQLSEFNTAEMLMALQNDFKLNLELLSTILDDTEEFTKDGFDAREYVKDRKRVIKFNDKAKAIMDFVKLFKMFSMIDTLEEIAGNEDIPEINNLILDVKGLNTTVDKIENTWRNLIKRHTLWLTINSSSNPRFKAYQTLEEGISDSEELRLINELYNENEDISLMMLYLDSALNTGVTFVDTLMTRMLDNRALAASEATKEKRAFNKLLKEVLGKDKIKESDGKEITRWSINNFFEKDADDKLTGRFIGKYKWSYFFDAKFEHESLVAKLKDEAFTLKIQGKFAESKAKYAEMVTEIERWYSEDSIKLDKFDKPVKIGEVNGVAQYSDDVDVVANYKEKQLGDTAFDKFLSVNHIWKDTVSLKYIMSKPSDKYINEEYSKLVKIEDGIEVAASKEGELYMYIRNTIHKLLEPFEYISLPDYFVPILPNITRTNIDSIMHYLALKDNIKNSPTVIGLNNELFTILEMPGMSKLTKRDTLHIKSKHSTETKDEYEKRIVDEFKENNITNDAGEYFESVDEIKAFNANIISENNKFSIENMSYNLYDIMNGFITGTITYRYKKEIESELLLGLQQLEHNVKFNSRNNREDKLIHNFKLSKFTGRKQYHKISGADSNTLERFSSWLSNEFYGINTSSKKIDKVIRPLIQFTSMKTMMFNISAGIKNISVGYIMEVGEAVSGYFIKPEHLRKATALYTKDVMFDIMHNRGTDESSTLAGAIIKRSSGLLELHDEKGNNIDKSIKNAVDQILVHTDALYFANNSTEHFMQYSMLLANTLSHRVQNGKIISWNDYMNDNRESILRTLLTSEQLKQLDNYIKIRTDREEASSRKHDYFGDWYRRELKNKHISTEVSKKYAEELKKSNDLKKEEFNKLPTLYDSMEVVNGYAEFKEGSELTVVEYSRFEDRVLDINHGLQGIYNKIDRSKLQYQLWGEALLQFRKWMRPYWNRYYAVRRGGAWNERSGTWTKGAYVSLWDFMKTPFKHDRIGLDKSDYDKMMIGGFMNYVKDTASFLYRLKTNWNTLDEFEKANIRRALMSMANIVGVAILLGLIGLTLGGDDDENKSIAYSSAIFTLNGIYTELMSPVPVLGWYQNSKMFMDYPMASEKTLIDLWSLTYTMLAYPLQSEDDRTIKAGLGKGEVKAWRNFKKNIPVYREINKWQHMPNYVGFYKMYNPLSF